MGGRIGHGVAVVCLVAGLAGTAAHAQEARKVGEVARIALGEEDEVEVVQRRQGELLGRVAWRPLPIIRDSSLFLYDLVRLHDDLVVHTRYAVGDTRGAVYFRRGPDLSAGSYEIQADTATALSDFQLVLRLGSMVVQRESGRFVAFMLGKRAVVPGSTVLFTVTEENTAGRVYLREGSLSIPECGITVRDARDVAWEWDLRRDECPRLLPLTRPLRRSLRREVRFATHTVWRGQRFFFFRPKGYLPLLGGAGVGILIWALTRDGPGSADGSVVVTIPD